MILWDNTVYGERFFYDAVGNITSENTIWRDLLTSVTKGSTTHTLFYDGTGNPINYGNGDKLYTNLTWENGRELTSLTTGDITYTYAYDAEGIRTSKTVNGVTHSYITQNGKVVRETIGTGATAKVLDFIYDNNGRPFALRYSTNGGSSFTTYYYVLNLQGDVVQMIDASGTIVATYRYNARGKLYSQAGTMAIMNPLRYRGYYYDTETGFYYLQSRYYDPENCRFINADSYTSTGQGFLGYNMFVYCNNNPISYVDLNGCIPRICFGLDLPPGAGVIVEINGEAYYYYSTTNSWGQLYEYWYDCNGNLVRVRHHSTHGESGRTNPHDHMGYRTEKGHNTESKEAFPPDDNFKPPNSQDGSDSSSKPGDNSNNNLMQTTKHAWTAVALPIIAYGGYQLLKWDVAALLAPCTGGGSFIIAGATP